MKVVTYTLTGSEANELDTVLLEELEPAESHIGDGFAVLLAEEFDLYRTLSNMQATVILDYQSQDTCTVKVAVGGGASGLLSLTWGSELKTLETLTRRLEVVFDDLGLTVNDSSEWLQRR